MRRWCSTKKEEEEGSLEEITISFGKYLSCHIMPKKSLQSPHNFQNTCNAIIFH